jgi:hypothetical protein
MASTIGRTVRIRMPIAYLSTPTSVAGSKGKKSALTAARLRQLSEPQQRVIAGDRLKGDIAVPAALGTLLLVEVEESVLVYLLGLLGADHADLVIFTTKTTPGVADGMDVEL